MLKGEAFKKIREKKGFSQKGVAGKIGSYSSSLSKFERGHSKRDNLMILTLAKFYDLPTFIVHILTKDDVTVFENSVLERFINKL